ncbi:MAG: UvrD-helicase domain-containing protein, partial [Planctomycetes bacterium]|nr:UvrD-helicase domain-containing protein [Planctomycetota bacterium]
MTSNLLDDLSNQQAAALSLDHARWLCVEAGAGAGKTRVMATRFVLLIEAGEALDEIVAITFTRKAAQELASRVQMLINDRVLETRNDPNAQEVFARLSKAQESFHLNRIGTIDSFCRGQLAKHALEAGVEPGFGQLDENRAARLKK